MATETKEVKLMPVTEKLDGELSEKIFYTCSFCNKTIGLYPAQRILCEKLSGSYFHCNFCLRNNYHTKISRHILTLSFRSIVGYYYYRFHVPQKTTTSSTTTNYYGQGHHVYNSHHTTSGKMWVSDIEDFIKNHIIVGMQNPAFDYDPETMLWFVNFLKVGRGRRKLRVDDIKKTIVDVLLCFNLPHNLPGVQMHKFYSKYSEAVDEFYKQRTRPKGRKQLIPTLLHCGVDIGYQANYDFETTRNFTRKDLVSRP